MFILVRDKINIYITCILYLIQINFHSNITDKCKSQNFEKNTRQNRPNNCQWPSNRQYFVKCKNPLPDICQQKRLVQNRHFLSPKKCWNVRIY